MRLRATLVLLLAAVGADAGRAQTSVPGFDRLDGSILKRLLEGDAVRKHATLDPRELALLPSVLPGLRAPVLVVKTDQGNFARILASHALRQPSDPAAARVPIVILDRFETFEPGSEGKRIAQGRERVLFAGFQIDLDSGQIVPPGCGGDLTVELLDGTRPALAANPGAELFSLARNPFENEKGGTARPSAARQVRPSDFTGSYRLVANGQWTGDLDLDVDDQGHARGRYRSDQTGAVYQVRGQTAKAPANQVELTVQFPRSELVLTGWLWTEGKSAFAGSARLDDRPFGFVAIRRGSPLSSDDRAVGAAADAAPDTADLSLAVDRGGRARRDGQELEADGLRAALAAIRERSETPLIRLGVDPDCPFAALSKLLAALEEAGPVEIRLGRPAP